MANARHDMRGHEELPSEKETLRAGFNALRRLLPQDEVQSLLDELPVSILRLWHGGPSKFMAPPSDPIHSQEMS